MSTPTYLTSQITDLERKISEGRRGFEVEDDFARLIQDARTIRDSVRPEGRQSYVADVNRLSALHQQYMRATETTNVERRVAKLEQNTASLKQLQQDLAMQVQMQQPTITEVARNTTYTGTKLDEANAQLSETVRRKRRLQKLKWIAALALILLIITAVAIAVPVALTSGRKRNTQ